MRQLFVLLVISVFILHACTASQEDPVPDNITVTYTGDIKHIMDVHCLSCHGAPPTNGAPMSLTTLDAVKEAIIDRGLIERVEEGSMPPTGTPLTNVQVQALKDWKTENYPQ